MDHPTSFDPNGSTSASKARRRVRARGTDVSFALDCDEELAMSVDRLLDQAIERGIELLQAETSERVEQRFYSGRC